MGRSNKRKRYRRKLEKQESQKKQKIVSSAGAGAETSKKHKIVSSCGAGVVSAKKKRKDVPRNTHNSSGASPNGNGSRKSIIYDSNVLFRSNFHQIQPKKNDVLGTAIIFNSNCDLNTIGSLARIKSNQTQVKATVPGISATANKSNRSGSSVH